MRQATPTIFAVLVWMCSALAWGQDSPELVVSSGHHQTIHSVDISPDGKYVLSADDNIVKVYDVRMQQELITHSDHSASIRHVRFSADGKYLVSSSSNEILIYNHPGGKLQARIDFDKVRLDFDFHTTRNQKIIVGNDRDGLEVFQLATGEREINLETVNIDQFLLLPDEKTIIANTANEEGQTGLTFYSFPSGELSYFLPIEGFYMEKFSSNKKGDLLAIEVKGGEVALIDVATKEIKRRIVTGGVGRLNIMRLSPDGKQLYTSGFDNMVRLWEVSSGKKLMEIKDLSPAEGASFSMSMNIKEMDISDDNKMFALCYSDISDGRQSFRVEWFDVSSFKSLGFHSGEVKIPLSMAIDKSGTVLSTGTITDAMGVKCLDVVNGNQKAFIPSTAYLASSGDVLAAVNMKSSGNVLELYQLPAVRLIRTIDLYGFSKLAMSSSGQYVAAIDQKYVPNSDPSKPQVIPFVRVWSIDTGKEWVHLERSLLDNVFDLKFTVDDKEILLLYRDRVERVDIATGKSLGTAKMELNLDYNNSISPDSNELIGTGRNEIYGIDFITGEQRTVLPIGKEYVPFTTAFSPDKSLLAVSCYYYRHDDPYRVFVYDWATKTVVCELIGHSSTVLQLAIDHENKHLYSIDFNGIIAMWDISECILKSSFLTFGAEDYIIINPEGYYKSSKGNIANIGFRLKGQLYSFDQFDLRYNRPDKVLESIGLTSPTQIALYEKAYQKRLSRMGFTEDDFSASISAPELRLLNDANLPLQISAEQIELEYEASDQQGKLDRLQILVNDVPIFGKQGKSLKDQQLQRVQEKVSIPLAVGLNKIQLAVMNDEGIESARANYSVECKKPAGKPNLYLVAFGVRSFQDSTMNLTYSDKDAKDLSELLERSAGKGVYASVQVKLFTNEKVVKESLIEARQFLLESKIDDQVILFFSGHGLLSQDLDYYLSTNDVDFSHPENRGIPFNDFQDLIDAIPSRNRLLLVDACHSGEVDKDEVIHAPENDVAEVEVHEKTFAAKGKKVIGLASSFELMKDLFVELRKEAGATVIASSSGKEFSLESDEWQNGVFTFALKEALEQGKADANEDKRISVSELKKFLFERVKVLTNGKQVPTARTENLTIDKIVY